MLPNLKRLSLNQTGMHTGALDTPLVTTELEDGDGGGDGDDDGDGDDGDDGDGGALFFKAMFLKPGQYLLSNLFGAVEWEFQRAKFRKGSPVYDYLMMGEVRENEGAWTEEQFVHDWIHLNGNKQFNYNHSYLKMDGRIASGLLAKFVSLIPRADATNLMARKRLGYLLNTKTPTAAVMKLWQKNWVFPDTKEEDKLQLMEALIEKKFTVCNGYGYALLRTGRMTLHEAGTRGKGSLWEYGKLNPDYLLSHPHARSDQLGKLLMARRSALQAQMREGVLGI